MEHQCPFCHGLFKSEKKYNVHLALVHECDADAESVPIQAIRSLEKTKDRVEYLLRKYPAARSNDWELFLMYNRLFNGLYVYNVNTKTVQFRNVIGISVNEFLHQTSFETIRRSRQSLQAKFKELRPSDRVSALRKAKESAYTDYFKEEKMGDWMPNTYQPTSAEA